MSKSSSRIITLFDSKQYPGKLENEINRELLGKEESNKSHFQVTYYYTQKTPS